MTYQEHKERTTDIMEAFELLNQQRDTIDPYESEAHGKMFDAIIEAQDVLQAYLMPTN